MTTQITIYQRDGCHLCEVAQAELTELQGEFDFELLEVDIESTDELHALYLERIPVIALAGEELYDFEINLPDLKSRLLAISAR
ncbi:MAG: glutaredoxin family protein [Solirubrobacterales bacterium]|nr:glutaredoxin family protein [Solirubrobacterales bacterium]